MPSFKSGQKSNRRASTPRQSSDSPKPLISKAPVPSGLNWIATFLPYGVPTMINLAWLSQNAKARKVASYWMTLDTAGKDNVQLDDLCDEVGITPAEFVGAVAGTAHELDMDVSAVFAGIARMADALSVAFARAYETPDGREWAVEALEFIERRLKIRTRR